MPFTDESRRREVFSFIYSPDVRHQDSSSSTMSNHGAPPPSGEFPHASYGGHHHWRSAWHEAAAGAGMPHGLAHHYWRYRARGPPSRFVWFAVGAWTTYMFTRPSRHSEERRELRALRTRYDGELASQTPESPATSRSWRWHGEYPPKTHEEAADTASRSFSPPSLTRRADCAPSQALQVSEAMLRSISQKAEELRLVSACFVLSSGPSKADNSVCLARVRDEEGARVGSDGEPASQTEADLSTRFRGRMRFAGHADSIFPLLNALQRALFSFFPLLYHYALVLVPAPVVRMMLPLPRDSGPEVARGIEVLDGGDDTINH